MPSSNFAAVAALAILAAAGGARADAPTSQCNADESVLFSCQVATKLVSLCATPTSGQIKSLAFRYGPPGHVETEFVANHDNDNRFFGTVSPAAPQASVKQVWFARADTKYLLTECVGGNCSQSAGLAVLRNHRVVSNERCARTPDDRAWFSKDLVKFGADIDNSQSRSDLLRLDDVDNDLDKIYGHPHDQ